jgi:hypothetical protein
VIGSLQFFTKEATMPSNRLVYIASKFGIMESSVQRLKTTLEERGYRINFDWTVEPISKPFEQNAQQAHEAAERMARAVMECDIMIVLCAPNGLGYHIETGGALVTSIILDLITKQRRKQIYVIGQGNDRSVFYFHDSVIRLPTVDSLLEVLI